MVDRFRVPIHVDRRVGEGPEPLVLDKLGGRDRGSG